jgi:hypothetical protein
MSQEYNVTLSENELLLITAAMRAYQREQFQTECAALKVGHDDAVQSSRSNMTRSAVLLDRFYDMLEG